MTLVFAISLAEMGFQDMGYKLGEIALKLSSDSNDIAVATNNNAVFNIALAFRKKSFREVNTMLEDGAEICRRLGFNFFACYQFSSAILAKFFYGENIITCFNEIPRCYGG